MNVLEEISGSNDINTMTEDDSSEMKDNINLIVNAVPRTISGRVRFTITGT